MDTNKNILSWCATILPIYISCGLTVGTEVGFVAAFFIGVLGGMASTLAYFCL